MCCYCVLNKPNRDLHRLSVIMAASDVRPTVVRRIDPLHAPIIVCVSEVSLEKAC